MRRGRGGYPSSDVVVDELPPPPPAMCSTSTAMEKEFLDRFAAFGPRRRHSRWVPDSAPCHVGVYGAWHERGCDHLDWRCPAT